jgi:ArsR family transcriptional regulator
VPVATAQTIRRHTAARQPLRLNERTLKLAAQQFRLLADPHRFRILTLLAQQTMSVTAICEALKRPQPGTSHNLTLLRLAGLVSGERHGRRIVYSLTPHGAGLLHGCQSQFIE